MEEVVEDIAADAQDDGFWGNVLARAAAEKAKAKAAEVTGRGAKRRAAVTQVLPTSSNPLVSFEYLTPFDRNIIMTMAPQSNPRRNEKGKGRANLMLNTTHQTSATMTTQDLLQRGPLSCQMMTYFRITASVLQDHPFRSHKPNLPKALWRSLDLSTSLP